jgi:hypothetical protein
MIKVTIKNLSSIITHGAQFETQGGADAWIAAVSPTGAWGKPDRWVHVEDIEAQGEDIAQAIESQTTEGFDGPETSYRFSAEFTIEQTDITTEVAAVRLIGRRLAKQQKGAEILAKIAELNRTKGYTQTQFNQILADTTLLVMERLAYSGSLDLFKSAVIGYSGPWYTELEKASIIADVDAWYSANPGV